MKWSSSIAIDGREISVYSPVYFIADLASNHDGDLEKAEELIWLAKDSGASAVKFQHFLADKIVSDYGFKCLEGQASHQAKWEKSVYEVYKENECDREWSERLARTARKAQIDLLTTPYDAEAADMMEPYLAAYKIGSGDITWTSFLEYVARKNKPMLLATGASSMEDVERAVDAILKYNTNLVLMQCNTNYTGSHDNFKYINLQALRTFAIRYPNMPLGLSDHTPGHATVLGAVALGARVIEKHFTSDNQKTGPDHAFSMNPCAWREMVDRTKELELSLGTGIKKVEWNEQDTVIIQRRCLRAKRRMQKGQSIQLDDLEILRPAPLDSILPYQIQDVLGKVLLTDKEKGDAFYRKDLEIQYVARR